jgi:membrane-associated phospholipid phosphatase
MFAWSTAIAVSTLTTKQHYFVDAASGLLFSALIYAVFFRFARYEKLTKNSTRV